MPLLDEGFRVDLNPVPLEAREAWTLPDAALVYGRDVVALRYASRQGDLDTFRPPNRDGRPGKRKVSRKAMDRWIKEMEE